MDRFDLRVDVPPVAFSDLDLPESGDASGQVLDRVCAARDVQADRFSDLKGTRVNSDAEGGLLDKIAALDLAGKQLLNHVAERFGLSAGAITGFCAWPARSLIWKALVGF